jgi:hypothetical protein
MGAHDGLWREGRLAWERLSRWYIGRGGVSGGEEPGDAAVSVLGDIGLTRRLLDQAELAAVRAARRDGKPWAEIAAALGVTRQSAWERWRDLDVAPDPVDANPADPPPKTADEPAPRNLLSWNARLASRRPSSRVPSVIGLTWDDAVAALAAKTLFADRAEADQPPVTGADGALFVVRDQSPESGARVPTGSIVRLWLERGGGAGVREPRRPAPGPRSGRAALPEPSSHALG